ncbi:TIGR04283 family arsenosugar biosynthesis glycosyltransferase [Geobacter sp. AOG2]|uniref:TIGR04283 family arsenosugar biosynthesis glycosyltransferase n=1 Tax=Geobacter sp. AOG2 TaxID=1566347 RepID=UPI001CC37BF1|nr:TIGR04283 family arsenosugar biosynthesis glycosyltransferase [Geobacter sp. AOG2]GFE59611.1 glycosyl transferase [Geobacter sp. AOG2]
MTHGHTPELSIIVPVLNEVAQLPLLFAILSTQQGLCFELILCDGGSDDGTLQLATQLALQALFTTEVIRAPRGRGRQMNAGAGTAHADTLLFLHADSTFATNDTLVRGLSALQAKQAVVGSHRVAGRFALRFRRSNDDPSLAYFFYEAKTRLPRKECIRGDQAFMLSRSFFRSLNGFDEQMPFLEDVRFVEAVAARGDWLLLPAEIGTSARRFETEGLWERQVLNAIIVNCLVAEWTEFFTALSGLYRFDANTGRLSLYPILDGIRVLLSRRSRGWRRAFWRTTGHHVAANAWQLFFWQDARRAFAGGKGVGEVESHWLRLYEGRLKRFFSTFPAAVTAAAVVRIWFRYMLLRSSRRPATETRQTG